MAPLVLLAALLAAPPPPVFEAKDLAPATGPMSPTWPDSAMGPGVDRFTAHLRHRARQAPSLPALALPAPPFVLRDEMRDASGWKAYRLEVPARATVKARLHATHEAWFMVKVVGRWGRPEAGMLQNAIPTGNPEASFINLKAEPATVYVVVDTTEVDVREPFELHVSYPE